jgi:FMN-dependent NADH-azoreductase
MSKIFLVHSSARGEASDSGKLASFFKTTAEARGDAVKELDLAKHALAPLDETTLGAFFSPAEQHTEAQAARFQASEQLVEALFDADTLVIATGMYNFSVPATLKTFIDHVLRASRTFRYTENGPEGLVKGKKAVLLVTTGGVYSAGPMASLDFFVPYLKAVLGFIGITEVEVVRAEGLAFGPEVAASAIESAKAKIAGLV